VQPVRDEEWDIILELSARWTARLSRPFT